MGHQEEARKEAQESMKVAEEQTENEFDLLLDAAQVEGGDRAALIVAGAQLREAMRPRLRRR